MRNRHAQTRARRRSGPRPGWFAKTRALLVGALVLGVGGSLTLAAWTDTEHAGGTFAASTFGIVGSTDGSTFAEHPSGSPAVLSFATSPGAMSPGTTVYARFLIKTTAATNVAGTISMSGATVTGTGLGTYLRYGARTIPAASACDATSYAAGTSVVASGSPLGTAGSAAQNVTAAGASAVSYCFAVTLPAGTANAAQGLNATANWVFTATSNS